MAILTVTESYQYYYSFLHFGLSKLCQKIFEQSKVRHSKKPGRRKALHFRADIKITAQNYSFIQQIFFKSPLCAKLIRDNLSQQNIFMQYKDSMDSYILTYRLVEKNVFFTIHIEGLSGVEEQQNEIFRRSYKLQMKGYNPY